MSLASTKKTPVIQRCWVDRNDCNPTKSALKHLN